MKNLSRHVSLSVVVWFVVAPTTGRSEDLSRLKNISPDLPKGVSVMPLTRKSPKFFSSNPELFDASEDIAALLKMYCRTDTPFPKVSLGYFAMLKAINELGLIGFQSSDSTTRTRISTALKKTFKNSRVSHVRSIEVGDCIVLLWAKDDLGKTLDDIEKLVRKRLINKKHNKSSHTKP